MNKTYELRTIDQIDGLRESRPLKPRWTEYQWPDAQGLPAGLLDNNQYRGAIRIDEGNHNDGWWALDDLIRVVAGMRHVQGAGNGWTLLDPADLVQVMVLFRLIGADDRLEICLPTEYQAIVDGNRRAVEDQIRKSVAHQLRTTRA